MFDATLTLDGIGYIVKLDDRAVTLAIPHMSSEDFSLSPTNAKLLAQVLLAAVYEIEHGE